MSKAYEKVKDCMETQSRKKKNTSKSEGKGAFLRKVHMKLGLTSRGKRRGGGHYCSRGGRGGPAPDNGGAN